jgi:hypothetical protein
VDFGLHIDEKAKIFGLCTKLPKQWKNAKKLRKEAARRRAARSGSDKKSTCPIDKRKSFAYR